MVHDLHELAFYKNPLNNLIFYIVTSRSDNSLVTSELDFGQKKFQFYQPEYAVFK